MASIVVMKETKGIRSMSHKGMIKNYYFGGEYNESKCNTNIGIR